MKNIKGCLNINNINETSNVISANKEKIEGNNHTEDKSLKQFEKIKIDDVFSKTLCVNIKRDT